MKSTSINYVIRIPLIFIALILLSACATPLTPTNLDYPSQLPDQYGVAVVQVVSNTLRLSPQLPGWTSIFIVDLDNADNNYRLSASGTGLLNSRVFIGALPPGHYAMYNLQSFRQAGDVSYWMNAQLPRSLGTFFIEDNRISSLGTLVYQPLNGLSGVQQGEQNPYFVTRFDDTEELTTFVAEAYPDTFENLNPTALLGWEPDLNQPFRNEMNEFIGKISVGFSYHWFEDGRIAMTGPLGQLFWRDPATADWKRSDTGFNVEIASVIKYSKGYVAAGERGLILISDSLGGPWSVARGPNSQEAIYWMHYEPEIGFFALARAGDKVIFYSVDLGFSQWKSELEFEYNQGMLFTGAGKVHAIHADDETIVIFGDRRRFVYNMSSAEITSQAHANVFALSIQPDNTLVVVPGHFWSGTSRPEISYDYGNSWDKLRRIRDYERWKNETRSIPIVLNRSEILAVSHRGYRDERQVRYEELPRTRIVVDGNSQISSWGDEMLPNCTRLLPEISQSDLIFAACSDGTLMRSVDKGKTWQVDHKSGIDQEDATLEGMET